MRSSAREYHIRIAAAEQVVAHHLRSLTDLRKGTQMMHAHVLQHFLTFMRGHSCQGDLVLTEQHIVRWMTTYSSELAPSTAGTAFQVVNRYLAALTGEGLTASNLMAACKVHHGNASWSQIARALQTDNPQAALARLRSKRTPPGPLQEHIQSYTDLNRAVGKSYHTNHLVLLELDRFLGACGVSALPSITTRLIERWMGQMRCPPAGRVRKARLAKRFFDHLVAQRVITRNPIGARPEPYGRRVASSFKPFIYTETQVAAILAKAGQLPKTHLFPLRSHVYHTLLAMLYAVGLRVGEARRLRICDVDLQQNILLIRQTKFHKSRMVPFGPRLAACLQRYLSIRHTVLQPVQKEDPLFVALWRRPMAAAGIDQTFRKLLNEVGLNAVNGRPRPRIHDLRHTFAVHQLLRWYRQGVDVQSRLMLLSTFMGHVEIRSTEVYLTVTAELLSEANTRFHRRFADVAAEEGQS